MDYKYIEQLLERYWQCETTPEEENVLRAFFAQPDVPANLARYKALFVYEQQQAADGLGEDFDERLCQLAGVNKEKETKSAVVRAKRLSFAARLQPLYRAVAILAVAAPLVTSCPFSYEVCHHHPNSSSIFFCKRSGFLNGSDCMFPVKSRKVSFQLGIYQHRQLLMHLYPWLCGSKNEQHWYSMHESWNP